MSFQNMMTAVPAKSKAQLADEAAKAKVAEERNIREGILNLICDALKDAGASATRHADGGGLGRIHICVEEGASFEYVALERTKSGGYGWRTKYEGPHRVIVGDYGERKSFPPRKSGLNYPKIAEELITRVRRRIRKEARHTEKIEGQGKARQIAKRLTDCEYGNSWCDTTDYGKVLLKFACDEQQAKKLIACAIEVGVIKK